MFTDFSPVHRLRIPHPNHVGEVVNWFLALNHPVEAASLKRALMPPLPSPLDTTEHPPGCPASDTVVLVALVVLKVLLAALKHSSAVLISVGTILQI